MEAIFKRRSIRKYTNDAVSDEQIIKLLEAGMAAPSARNVKPWHFIVIKDRKRLEQLSEVSPYATMLKSAAVAIVVCGDTHLQELEGYIITDCSAATQNILLEVTQLGLGGVWLGVYPRTERLEFVRNFFSLPENILPVSMISIGYPDEYKESKDTFEPERVHWGKW